MKITLTTLFHQGIFVIFAAFWFLHCMITEGRRELLNQYMAQKLISMTIEELKNESVGG